MAQSCCPPTVISIKTEGVYGGHGDFAWSTELDHVPLIRRRESLLETRKPIVPTPKGIVVVKKEDGISDWQGLASLNSTSATSEGIPQQLIQQQTYENKTSLVNASEDEHGKSEVDPGAVDHCSEISTGQELAKHRDCNGQSTKENINITSDQSSLGDDNSGSPSANEQVPNLNDNVPKVIGDDLDNMALKERQKMLLARRILRPTKPDSEVF
uniref:Uncharacterized protein n=1 Tax=Rhizophora mucronata TaxID=61149 RepID=A0A2P2LND3_RHIMU